MWKRQIDRRRQYRYLQLVMEIMEKKVDDRDCGNEIDDKVSPSPTMQEDGGCNNDMIEVKSISDTTKTDPQVDENDTRIKENIRRETPQELAMALGIKANMNDGNVPIEFEVQVEDCCEMKADYRVENDGLQTNQESENKTDTETSSDSDSESKIVFTDTEGIQNSSTKIDHPDEIDTDDQSEKKINAKLRQNDNDNDCLPTGAQDSTSTIVSKVFNLTSSTVSSNSHFSMSDNDFSNEYAGKGIGFIEPAVANDQAYRMASLVAYSESEEESDLEESSCESEAESMLSPGDEDEDEYSTDEDTDDDGNMESKGIKRKEKSDDPRLRTEGELFPEELPPLDYLSISAGEDIKLEPLGTISGIVDVLVVIQSVDASPALFDDTVLFLENRQPLGLIFETMGTVEKPFYTVRFNSNDDIMSKDINVGDKVMYAPSVSNLTKYVFIAELKRRTFVDASWECDNEPPPENLEYSDDEQEKRAMRRLVMIRRRQERKERKEDGTEKKRRKKKKKATGASKAVQDQSSNVSSLPQGPMNRNPFGNPSEIAGRLNKKKSTSSSKTTESPSTTSSNNTNNKSSKWTAPRPQGLFGGQPTWSAQYGSTGSAFQANTSTFSATLPPVYNTNNPVPTPPTGPNPFSIPPPSVNTNQSQPPQTPPPSLPRPNSTPSPFSVPPPIFNTNQPPPQTQPPNPTPSPFSMPPPPQTPPSSMQPPFSTPSPFGMPPPIFNTSQGPPPQTPPPSLQPLKSIPSPFNMQNPTFNTNQPPPPQTPPSSMQPPFSTPSPFGMQPPTFNTSQGPPPQTPPPSLQSIPSPFSIPTPAFNPNQPVPPQTPFQTAPPQTPPPSQPPTQLPNPTPSPFSLPSNPPSIFGMPSVFNASQPNVNNPFMPQAPLTTNQPQPSNPLTAPNLFMPPTFSNNSNQPTQQQPLTNPNPNPFSIPPTFNFNTTQQPPVFSHMFPPHFNQTHVASSNNAIQPTTGIPAPPPSPSASLPQQT